ncbi:MAG: hypothetical protein EOS58_06905 [Mesorhizobium sp.]|uniref:hypothetical protein n=1 Tax=unclassified Mesorhizobium TaxID=325217 RepID=UPI000FCB131A|nr:MULTISPECIES: hypothetical protein [unclassified Mesorhizobium]RUX48450.1 hypothetical protein EOA33_15540 [Mesorhizobium sp. M4A.F.Ca.ET.050.02.1.1]RVD42470.1 hypothetical protein EN742_07515 [Mesorhizobium sp. M4A.F.Ca.ET.020.02.1.1]RWC14363.1 MAG: hypothetical protein EOS53_22830 [Mesorhizobium sp.]RWD06729.1 MAG: hypothetical protein EOS58_06905 [Mesorhizobium sp.]RWD24306.1 MAG: hypothetical protein EOS33_25110 [Mesorhizobium sp.]
MSDLDLSSNFYVEWSANGDLKSGRIFHIERNASGGSLSTPVARFFMTNARIPAEGFFPHQRLDCFVSNTEFVSKPEQLARDLFKALSSRNLIDEPTWLGWHVAEEQGGAAFGEVFDFD